jgi:hypothetical protein
MDHKSKNKLLRLPAFVWIAQLIYVVGSLLLLAILLRSLDIGSVSPADVRLFTAVYVATMLIANIIWRLAIMRKHTIVVAIIIGAAIIINIGVAQIFIVQNAHNSFANYYKFRGCTELISRSDTSGVCKLSSGETIEIVLFQGKWYLDGDLPNGWF